MHSYLHKKMDNRIVSTAVLTLSRQQEEFLARYRTHEAQKSYFESYGLGVTPFFRGGGGSHGVISPAPVKPYDYEVEYLEINSVGGSLFIDPDIYVSGLDYKIEIEVLISGLSTGPGNLILYNSSGNTNARYDLVRNGNSTRNFLFFSNSPSFIATAPYSVDKFIKVVSEGNNLYVDNVLYSGNGTSEIKEPESKIQLFGANVQGYFYYLKIKSFSFTKGMQELRNMVCVSKDGIGYMYDKVTGKLFGAQGGGSFIVGPRKE